jgi:hypothetical protein
MAMGAGSLSCSPYNARAKKKGSAPRQSRTVKDSCLLSHHPPPLLIQGRAPPRRWSRSSRAATTTDQVLAARNDDIRNTGAPSKSLVRGTVVMA